MGCEKDAGQAASTGPSTRTAEASKLRRSKVKFCGTSRAAATLAPWHRCSTLRTMAA